MVIRYGNEFETKENITSESSISGVCLSFSLGSGFLYILNTSASEFFQVRCKGGRIGFKRR